MDIVKQIESGRTSIGIEFGSTRIKAVMIGEDYSPIASGTHDCKAPTKTLQTALKRSTACR